MNPCRVLWRETAVDQLADIWLAAPDRDDVRNAVTAIDTLLFSDPLGDLMLELAEGLRTVTVLPVRVIYVVDEANRIVDVATVRRISAPTP